MVFCMRAKILRRNDYDLLIEKIEGATSRVGHFPKEIDEGYPESNMIVKYDIYFKLFSSDSFISLFELYT